MEPQTKSAFAENYFFKPPITSHKRGKSLKDTLVRSKILWGYHTRDDRQNYTRNPCGPNLLLLSWFNGVCHGSAARTKRTQCWLILSNTVNSSALLARGKLSPVIERHRNHEQWCCFRGNKMAFICHVIATIFQIAPPGWNPTCNHSLSTVRF